MGGKNRKGYTTDLRNFNIYIDRVDNKLTFKALSLKYNLSDSCIKKIINNLKCKLLDYTFNYKQKKDNTALKDALKVSELALASANKEIDSLNSFNAIANQHREENKKFKDALREASQLLMAAGESKQVDIFIKKVEGLLK